MCQKIRQKVHKKPLDGSNLNIEGIPKEGVGFFSEKKKGRE